MLFMMCSHLLVENVVYRLYKIIEMFIHLINIDNSMVKILICLFYFLGFKNSVTCKPDWEKFGDNCYHLVRGKKSWMDAFKTCHALGSGLVDVGSSEENSFLHSKKADF